VHRPGQFSSDNHFGAEVRITLDDGRVLSDRVDIQLGRTADNPIPPAQLRSKFLDCAGRALPPALTTKLALQLDALLELQATSRLMALTVPDHSIQSKQGVN
jgi:hypothetical protein